MPELPEVETIRRGLEKKIVGLTIKNLQVFYPKGVQFDPKDIEDRKVLGVWRRAKMLGIDLSLRGAKVTKQSNTGDRHASLAMTLLFHLKMTGQLILVARLPKTEQGDGGQASDKSQESRLIGGHPTPDMRNQMPNKSTVAVFEFNDNSHLYFNDQRRFGWIRLVNREQVTGDSESILGKLGPEPFDPKFTWEILKQNLLKHKSQPVKVAIMDQSVLSGVGNIYASESLFLAKIDPRRKVSSLSDQDFKNLFSGIKKSLELAIEKGGSTRADFVNVDGERGYFLDYANVYGKEGYKCHCCSGKVEKITQAGRGTYWCPSCQK